MHDSYSSRVTDTCRYRCVVEIQCTPEMRTSLQSMDSDCFPVFPYCVSDFQTCIYVDTFKFVAVPEVCKSVIVWLVKHGKLSCSATEILHYCPLVVHCVLSILCSYILYIYISPGSCGVRGIWPHSGNGSGSSKTLIIKVAQFDYVATTTLTWLSGDQLLATTDQAM